MYALTILDITASVARPISWLKNHKEKALGTIILLTSIHTIMFSSSVDNLQSTPHDVFREAHLKF